MKTLVLRMVLVLCILIPELPKAQNIKPPLEYLGREDAVVFGMDLSEDQRYIAFADNREVVVYNAENRSLEKTFTITKGVIKCIKISSEDKIIVVGDDQGKITLFDLENGSTLFSQQLHNGKVNSIDYDSKLKFIVSGSSDGQVVVFDAANKKIHGKLGGHKSDITRVKVSNSSTLIATASADKTIRIWDLSTLQALYSLNKVGSIPRDLIFRDDDAILYSSGDDSFVRSWKILDTAQPYLVNKKKFEGDWLLCLDLHGEDVIATGSLDGRLNVYHRFGSYVLKIKDPIRKVKLLIDEVGVIRIIASTLGSGVFIVDAREMEFVGE